MSNYNSRYGAPRTSNKASPSGETAWRPYTNQEQSIFGDYNDERNRQPTQVEDTLAGMYEGGAPSHNVTGTLVDNTSLINSGVSDPGGPPPDSAGAPFMGVESGTASVDQYDPTADPHSAIMDQLMGLVNAGVRDTSAEEQEINDRYAGKMGAGMGDLAAQFGAGGMGQSGALLGAGADLQGQLARDASREILGVQQGARDEWVRNLMNAVGASQAERQTGMDELGFGLVYDTLMESMNTNPDGSPKVDEDGDGFDDNTNAPMGYDAQDEATLLGHILHGLRYGAGQVFGPDSGGVYVGGAGELPEGSSFLRTEMGQEVYEGPDGTLYYVPISSGGE